MTYDFSNLYNTETIDIKRGDTVLFQVTVQEISNETHNKIQSEMFSGVDLSALSNTNKKGVSGVVQQQIGKVLSNGSFSPIDFATKQTLAGVQSWTLTSNGEPVPVSCEAWNALPLWITSEIEKGVKRLNPDLDEEFQG